MRRLRQHINPLKISNLVARDAPLPIPDGPELEVELGCGDASFLIGLAEREPDRLFVGLDIRREFLSEGRAAVSTRGLENIQLHTSNLQVDAPHLFFAGRVRRFYINFPDPWFKRRHHNRRWLGPETLAHLIAALASRGEIFFQSDVWDVALEALALFEASASLENLCGSWTFLRVNPFGVQTSRERACLDEGRTIWRLHYAKCPDDSGDDDGDDYD
jgi:tRNA (guanine-N7-)-methyltransferase